MSSAPCGRFRTAGTGPRCLPWLVTGLLGAALLLAGGGSTSAAQAELVDRTEAAPLVVINFEDYPANPPGEPATAPVREFYLERGVVFRSDVNVLEYEASPDVAASGTRVAAACYAAELCTDPVRMDFTLDQARVRVLVGLDVGEPSAGQEELVLTAFDDTGSVIDRVFGAVDATTVPVPVGLPLEVRSSERAIRAVEVSRALPARTNDGLLIDDVELEAVVPRLVVEPSPVELGEMGLVGGTVEGEVVIRNDGNVPATIRSAVVEGSDEFVVDDVCGGRTLAPGESCVLRVVFRPAELGPREGVLVLSSSVSARFETPLRGTGVPPSGGTGSEGVDADAGGAGATGGPGTPPPAVPGADEAGGDWLERVSAPVAGGVVGAVLVVALLVLAVAGLRRTPRGGGGGSPAALADVPRVIPPGGARVRVRRGRGGSRISSDGPLAVVTLTFDPARGGSTWRRSTP